MNTSAVQINIPSGQPRGTLTGGQRIGMATKAFIAIMHRDLVVTLRELISFLVQQLLQPLFFLFVFGRVLTGMGFVQGNFASILLPGIVSLTIVLTAMQAISLGMVLELGYSREIDDRLLAPLPVELVAIEKVIFAALRGLLAGVIVFPLGYIILGNGYQVRGDEIPLLIGLMILMSIMGAALGLVIGTVVKPEQLGVMFSLIFAPLIFTGCIYNPWGTLGGLKWFQIVTLFNPLTYASEGLRAAMLPASYTQAIPPLGLGWVLLGLCVSCIVFLVIGMRTFRGRVIG